MNNLDQLRMAYVTAREVLDIAQKAEREARSAEYKVKEELRAALADHVRARFEKNQIMTTRAHGEIMITDISVPVDKPTEVRAVYRQRLKSKEWAKTKKISAGLIWNFDTGRWRAGVHYTSGRIEWDDQQ